ncbi:Bug family tripartite tricarboxylate transporter substrate binding protein [Ramlibacter sp.]|uniref:Bug family tripartite tricarboxylate transporter substrate binding protein n=1 Tax=Ramlibacter sp. TaxID=1917967 RepID=UPI003D108F64
MNSIDISRRRIVTAAGGLLAASFAHAQGANPAGWPTKPIRLVIPYGTGGATDAIGRLLATKMADVLGQPVVIDNRPGANGAIGTAEVARAPADGYTFGLVSSSHVVNPFVNKDIGYNVRADFAPVTTLTRLSSVLVVHPSVPARNVRELVALVKQNPDKYFYGIAGGLSNGHVMMERFKHEAGLKVTPVVFKGAGPAALELVAGRIQMMIVAPPGVKQFIEAGKLNALASTGSRNPVGFPNLPNMADEGFSQLESYEWLGLITRAGTPRPIVDRVNSVVVSVLRDPAVTKVLNGQSHEVVADSPEAMGQFINRELDRFSVLVKTLDLKD